MYLATLSAIYILVRIWWSIFHKGHGMQESKEKNILFHCLVKKVENLTNVYITDVIRSFIHILLALVQK